jgi:hypothetical protein
VSGEREQSWYPVGRVAWFTRRAREGIGVTAGQLGRLLPAPGQLDNAAVAGIIGVRRDQAGGLVPSPGQAGSWNAVPGFTPARRAAVWDHEAAIGELRRLGARVLAAAGQLKPVTIDAMLAGSGLRPGSAA